MIHRRSHFLPRQVRRRRLIEGEVIISDWLKGPSVRRDRETAPIPPRWHRSESTYGIRIE